MSFSIFRLKLGRLYVRDYCLNAESQRLLKQLNLQTHKIIDQDDLFCVIGSSLCQLTNSTSANTIAAIFINQLVELVTDPHEMQLALAKIDLHVSYESAGYWRPDDNSDGKLMFIQSAMRAKSAKSGLKIRSHHQRPDFQIG